MWPLSITQFHYLSSASSSCFYSCDTRTRAIWLRMTAVPPITAFESVNDYNIFMQSSCQIYRAVLEQRLHEINFSERTCFIRSNRKIFEKLFNYKKI